MRGVTYAFLGAEDQAAKFAKKGTATDITLWNAKKGDAHLNMVTATRFPEKILSLLYALDLADEVILQPAQVDRSLGEAVVACELLGKTRGFLRSTGTPALEELRNLLSRTALKDLTATGDADAVFRESLYERAAATNEGPLVLPVDHSFPVKGVGTVVLGLVRSGEVKAHQSLQIFPTEKTLEVRSIQVHDVEQPTAGTRSRVGLAVKNAEPDDVRRGTILAPKGSLKVLAAESTIQGTLQFHPFSKWQPRPGAVLHAFHVLQDVVLRIDSVEPSRPEAKFAARLEGALTWVPGQAAVLVDVDNKAQRLVGRMRVDA